MDAMRERKDLRHCPVILVGRGGEGGKRFSKPDDPSTGSSAACGDSVGNRFSKRDESSKSASGEEGSKGGKRSLKSDDSSNSFSGEDGSVSGSRKVLSRTDSPEPDDFCNRHLSNLGLVSWRSENWTPCTRHWVLDDSWNGPSSGPHCVGIDEGQFESCLICAPNLGPTSMFSIVTSSSRNCSTWSVSVTFPRCSSRSSLQKNATSSPPSDKPSA
jgi:hypothetical protein